MIRTAWVRLDKDGTEWVRHDVSDALNCSWWTACMILSLACATSGGIYLWGIAPDDPWGLPAFMSLVFGGGGALGFGFVAGMCALEWRRTWLKTRPSEPDRSIPGMVVTHGPQWDGQPWFGQVLVAWLCGRYGREK